MMLRVDCELPITCENQQIMSSSVLLFNDEPAQPQQCRCCLAESPSLVYRSILNDNQVLPELLQCLPGDVNIEPHDGLPEVICDACWASVRISTEFRRRCAASDKELRRRHEAASIYALEEALTMGVDSMFADPFVPSLQPTEATQYATQAPELSDLLLLDDNCNFGGIAATTTTSDINELIRILHAASPVPPAEHSAAGPGTATTATLPPIESILNGGRTATPIYPVQPVACDNVLLSPVAASSPSYLSPAEQPECARLHPQPQQPEPTDVKGAKHSCPKCSKMFTRNFQLKLHLISVHNLGDGLTYECTQCQRNFASRHSLNYHQKSTHSADRPYACALCSRRFILRSQLLSHTRTHNGDRPRRFECSYCQKMWPTKSDLLTHLRSHQKDDCSARPFRCEHCGKGFYTRGHLSSHLLVHTGEKPFTCTICQRCYQSSSNLNNHLMKRHPETGCAGGRRIAVAAAETSSKSLLELSQPQQAVF